MNALEYFKAFKIEEISSQYQEQGHQIVVSKLEIESPFEVSPLPYHLTATKCCRKLAHEVVERTNLTDEWVDRLREQAHQEGFDTFMMTIQSPPAQTSAHIEGIELEIFDYLVENQPDQIAELPAKVRPLSVEQIGVNSVSLMAKGMRVVGNGVVSVELENGEEMWQFGFPLSFEVELDHQLRLKVVYDITADTSSFYQSGHK